MKLYRQGAAVNYYLASPEEILAAFNDLPEWDQLRAIAGILDTLKRPPANPFADPAYSSRFLRGRADLLEREDAERAQRDQEVEELAQDLAESAGYSRPTNCTYQRARDLYAKGYRKQADDE